MNLQPGDRLMLLDGQPVYDVFDYELRAITENLLLTIQKSDGETIEFDIEKDADEDLGLEFANPLLDDCTACQNHCIFCFIDQLPAGMRESLYFKDDDCRLSFLTGNYVTLTNLDDEGLQHLIACRLSPVNVSVHATDPALRTRLLRQKNAGRLLEQLRAITGAGLKVNAQIVLCPDVNDGVRLHETLSDLAALGPAIQSVAIVPVGLTRYREDNGLFKLRPLQAEDAIAALDEVAWWQSRMLAERQTRLVYAADEIYLKAGRELPPAHAYEDFPQLENGVGMASLLQLEMDLGLDGTPNDRLLEPLHTAWPRGREPQAAREGDRQTRAVLLASGTAAEPLLKRYATRLTDWSGIRVRTSAVQNRFFGEQVTVAGLLTGQDLVEQLPQVLAVLAATLPQPASAGELRLILPDCLLKAGEDVLLDGYTVQRLADELGVVIHVCAAEAAGLLGVLGWLAAGNGWAMPGPELK